MTDERIKELIGELHALLRGDTGYTMAEGDVQFFDAGSDSALIVDIRDHRYLIMVKDLGIGHQAMTEAAVLPRKLNS